jgi:hypothetical protein
MPENKPNPNPNPAPPNGAGAQEGGQGSNTPLPRYVISPQELKLLGWLRNAKVGDRIDITTLTPPPPPPPGAARVSGETKYFNIRIRYDKKKSTLILKSGGFTVTVNPLRGVRVYKDGEVVREYDSCWSSLLFSTANKVLTEYGYNVFTERWTTISLPNTDRDVRRLIALVVSLIHSKINELRDPLFSRCLSSKTPS